MSGMEAVIQEFLAESFENLDSLDQDLVNLEKNPSDRSIFERVFRTIHTIKGTCGFLAFSKLEKLTHTGESVLSSLRDGELKLTPEITSSLLEMFDAVRAMLAAIKESGADGERDYAELISRLGALEEAPVVKASEAPTSDQKKKTSELITEASPTGSVSVAAKPDRKTKKTERGKVAKIALDDLEDVINQKAPVTMTSKALETTPQKKAQTEKPKPTVGEEGQPALAPAAVASETIRVDVAVFDRLMNLVGELVLARNHILQYSSTATDANFVAATQRLNSVTGELQEAVMKTRMQPISAVWSKLPRFVRDLAVGAKKEVELVMHGQDTELDKSVIDAIKGSLLHLIRNSVDHGIESPEIREGAGKNRAGQIVLDAYHEGGSVVIDVKDDGSGLNRELIIERAVSRGLVAENRASTLSNGEIESLLFTPGFSTAKAVTNISGRGVGLDAVRANIESIGGLIDLKSVPGQSTSFRMKIPLTLAIIPVLIVSVGRHRFAIPQVTVIELVRITTERSERGIEKLNGVPVYRLRGNLLPLVFLNSVLGIDKDSTTANDDGSTNIVVLHGDNRKFGLVVDSIDDTQEIVVKPLGRLLKGLPYAGATILGDGKVSIILDIFRLGVGAGVVSETRERGFTDTAAEEQEVHEKLNTLLLIEGADGGRRAIPFNYISRLEFLPRSRIEYIGDLIFIQYREEILQLISLESVLPERRSRTRTDTENAVRDTMQVVVCSIDGRSIGLIIDRIVDIVEENLKSQRPASREGVEACVVIQSRVTEILDMKATIRLGDFDFFDRPLTSAIQG